MARSPIWRAIADTLTAEIARAHYAPGDRLPTEAELADRFGVNRHTVRHALAALTDQGLIHTRRGRRFVAARRGSAVLGRHLEPPEPGAQGRNPARGDITCRRKPGLGRCWKARRRLNPCKPAMPCMRSRASSADGGRCSSPGPARRSRCRACWPTTRTSSITEALAAEGVADYTRATTRLTAIAAPATLALLLRLPEAAPLLRSTSVNIDPQGRPLEFGTTWFAGDRVTLTVTPD
ncbi:MAG: GntR family transcriptional regulator [Gemmobacter sp.]|nr:GntR family transcriptional regulator [Gemmobacter sp.]